MNKNKTTIDNIISVFEGSKEPEDVFVELILRKNNEKIKRVINKEERSFFNPSDFSLTA